MGQRIKGPTYTNADLLFLQSVDSHDAKAAIIGKSGCTSEGLTWRKVEFVANKTFNLSKVKRDPLIIIVVLLPVSVPAVFK